MIGALAPLAVAAPPDVIVGGEGKIMAVRTPDNGLLVSNLRRSRFVREFWRRRLASEQTPQAWPIAGQAMNGGLNCDPAGCRFERSGKTVALIRHERALVEDCWSADAVVSLLPVRGRCPATIVIDRFSLWRKGAHALWLGADKIRVETVNQQRGWRPWVVRPAIRTAGSL